MENPDTVASPGISNRDSWAGLRAHTSARIALGRSGGSQRTQDLLDFRMSHAQARDAVTMAFNKEGVLAALRAAGVEAVELSTRAGNRAEYLLRPDLGRSLSERARAELQEAAGIWGSRDLAIVISDGLSPLAAERQAVPLVTSLLAWMKVMCWSTYPVFVVPFARVKLQDEIGQILGAGFSLAALGERPGLGAPDSLGVYFTRCPIQTCTDADRNCVSNIRPEGFPPAAAALKLARLLMASAQRGVSGVALKDDDTLPLLGDASGVPGT